MTQDKRQLVVSTALGVFLRHGYRKVTMGDIAAAASMSRPALYLVFASKEDVFRAVLVRHFEEALSEVRSGLSGMGGLLPRLTYALEVWCVRPFELTLIAPEARDLLASGYEFANEVVTTNFEAFEGLLAEQISHASRPSSIPAREIARVVVGASVGLKQSASTADELRSLLCTLLRLVIGESESASAAA